MPLARSPAPWLAGHWLYRGAGAVWGAQSSARRGRLSFLVRCGSACIHMAQVPGPCLPLAAPQWSWGRLP
jgi:hypothetical protein